MINHTLTVPSVEALEEQVRRHLMLGYELRTATPVDAIVFRHKRFEWAWAVLGFFVCVVPLFVYLLVYAAQHDVSVYIVVVLPPPPVVYELAAPPPPPVVQELSFPAEPYWDGTRWVVPGQQMGRG